VEKGAGRFAQVSGLTLAYDPKAEAGARVTEVLVAGAALDPAAVYKVAVNDYMQGGGDGYKVLKDAKQITNTGAGALVAQVVMDYVETQASVQPSVEGRIKALAQ
jgi:2',3'-cyclic-nucleotide 2'-phosphodiesterase (5'-nucleotidase family)